MTTEILNLIDKNNYSEAYELVKKRNDLSRTFHVWTSIVEGDKFESIPRNINFDSFDREMIDSVKLYIHLSNSNWDKELLAEFRKVAKMILAETSAEIRNISFEHENEHLIHNTEIEVNPEIRLSLQELIDHFDKKELYESKADMARVKSQLSLSMNLEKSIIGEDMIQYGKAYENVKMHEDSIQIYYAVVKDFEEAAENSDSNVMEQLKELTFLKEAYEGIIRLTNNPEIVKKLEKLKVKVSVLQKPEQKENKPWFKKIFGN